MLASSKYNMGSVRPAAAAITLQGSAVTTPSARFGKLDPDSPVVWLVGIGAMTLGLVAVSVHGRVGPISATVAGGK